jgi:methionyl-tRNA formyltransferase
MGTPAFSVPILEGLAAGGYQVLAVITQPDRKVGRRRILTSSPVKEAAVRLGISVLQPEKIANSSEMEEILLLQPDLIVTAAFGQFLPEKLLQVPRFGAINIHASLLPKYRGGAPVHFALINGERQTGVTIIEMVKKMDAGGMIAKQAIPIEDKDNVGILFEKLSILGRDLLLRVLPDYLAGKKDAIPQNEEEVSFAPNITCEMEQIDWTKGAVTINNQIRGMYPWPIAYTMYGDLRIKIHQATVIRNTKTNEAYGVIVRRTKKELWVAAGEGSILQLDEVQPAGKGKLSIVDFLNGVGKSIDVGVLLSGRGTDES